MIQSCTWRHGVGAVAVADTSACPGCGVNAADAALDGDLSRAGVTDDPDYAVYELCTLD